ncbi:MAG: hypothetical protein HN509_07780 [Halobacteriovoraceae bacterium]|jgi:hypothetical protein|nr:hypothetical protein [Halobacteriovoraceae bacterium]
MRNLIAILFLSGLLAGPVSATPGQDFSKVVAPSACMACHQREAKVWQNTKHNALFKKFHKRKNGKKIAKRLGIKRIKRAPLCLSCHYTANERKRIVAGVSCESCHNPAQDWMGVHNLFGGNGTKAGESAGQKAKRIRIAEKAGMAHPSNIYNVAKNCFTCHSIQEEKLVEVGGHKQGWAFELVTFTQGEVRHNFVNNKHHSNKEASPARKRQMYIVGRLLDLEMGLRGVAKVTARSKYAVKLAKRTKKALGHIKLILAAAPKSSSLSTAYQIGRKVQLRPNNSAKLIAAAEKIAKINIRISKGQTKSNYPQIDKLIPKLYKGTTSR